jgi:hypothetical protein
MITLLPKEPYAKTLKQYRPISLVNCSFKIFGKLLNNRLINVANRLIASNQTTFIKGVGISYAQLKYEGFRKRTENHCSILPGVFQVSLFIFYH